MNARPAPAAEPLFVNAEEMARTHRYLAVLVGSCGTETWTALPCSSAECVASRYPIACSGSRTCKSVLRMVERSSVAQHRGPERDRSPVSVSVSHTSEPRKQAR